MFKYQKIQSIFKRDNHGNFIVYNFSKPEFAELYNAQWTFYEKLDGMNTRVIFSHKKIENVPEKWIEHDGLYFSGKTDKAEMPDMLVEYLKSHFHYEQFKDLNCENVIIFGEGIGKKIQKNGELYCPDGNKFVAFDVLIDGRWWLKKSNFDEFMGRFDVECAPLIGYGTLGDMMNKCVKGFNSKYGDFIAEGIVAKFLNNICDNQGKRLIVKVKYKDFEGEREKDAEFYKYF